MNEEAAFRRAMDASPNDLALRLVFADWLEERGDPRGELLRLTHTLTQAIEIPQRSQMEMRVQELLQQGVEPIGPYWTNAVGMPFAWVAPGTFLMGSPRSEQQFIRQQDGKDAGDWVDKEIQHRVHLSAGFALGITPVTQAQWQAVMGKNPSHFKGDELPVERVSWFDAIAFCNALSQKDGKKSYYKIDGTEVSIVGGSGYRLPTEAEWEYACRAGSTTAYCFGDDRVKLGDYAWFSGNASSRTHAASQKKGNSWGLHDMHGNVWEWCWDWFGDHSAQEVTDPRGPSTGDYRLLRGGSWRLDPWIVRSAHRLWHVSGLLDGSVGLRVCCCLD